MTRNFIDLARELQKSAVAASAPPSAAELRLIELGRLQATQLVDALRLVGNVPGLIICAVAIIQKQGDAAILRGFLEECQDFLAQVPQ